MAYLFGAVLTFFFAILCMDLGVLGLVTGNFVMLLYFGSWKISPLLGAVWLPYAMEGPTPVSSLLHSATIVLTGIIAIDKVNLAFDQVHFALILALLASCPL